MKNTQNEVGKKGLDLNFLVIGVLFSSLKFFVWEIVVLCGAAPAQLAIIKTRAAEVLRT